VTGQEGSTGSNGDETTGVPDRATVVRLIQDVLAQRSPNLDPEQFTEDQLLEAVGMDSLDLINVLATYEERWGVQFGADETDPGRFGTIAGLTDALLARARAQSRGREHS
jgi:acyl carrier protein